MISLTFAGSLMPGNIILVPFTTVCGLAMYFCRVGTSQVMPEVLLASE